MSNDANKSPLRARFSELDTLRDEIRVTLHLASMDLRDEWKALERRLPDAAALASGIKEVTSDALESVMVELRALRDRIRSGDDRPLP